MCDRKMKRIIPTAFVLFAAILVAGCGDGGTDGALPSTPTPAETVQETPEPVTPSPIATDTTPRSPGPTDAPFQGGQDPVEGTPAVPDATFVPQLVDVRAAAHTGFDRIVFEFSGAPPGYRVEYITDPSDCGSGAPSFEDVLGGGAYLQVRFNPANAHDEAGNPTFGANEITMPDGGIARQTCDFEAVVTWVILLGRSAPRDFRVAQLFAPNRLVVDISQR
jgi:hypothetical protein